MKKKICLITGATAGVGKATAIALGKLGYTLVLTGRNIKKGARVVQDIKRIDNNSNVEFSAADISSLRSIRQFAENVKLKYEYLDVLINNAGAKFSFYKETEEGIERTFATNYLGHFFLTMELLNLLEAAPSARIINVASSAHTKYSNDFSNSVRPLKYNRLQAYGKSKLANIMFTYEMSRRIKNKQITVNALDPGGVYTRIGRSNWIIPFLKYVSYYLRGRRLLTPREGAETIVYLATSAEVEGISGKYFRMKKEIKSSYESYDKKAADNLWKISLGLYGIKDLTSE